MDVNVSLLTKKELRNLLHNNGLASDGNRDILFNRFMNWIPEACFVIRDCQGTNRIASVLDQNKIKIVLEDRKLDGQIVHESQQVPISLNDLYPNAMIIDETSLNARLSSEAYIQQHIKVPIQFSDHAIVHKKLKHIHAHDFNLCTLIQKYPCIVIVGATGSGKTTLLEEYGMQQNENHHEWDPSKAIVSQFGDDYSKWLVSAGLTSIPSWCKPYHILSTGERFRADLARHLQRCDREKQIMVEDDFASRLDRRTAITCSVICATLTRRLKIPLIVTTANRDIVRFLKPDVVVDLDTMELVHDSVYHSPKVLIHISRNTTLNAVRDHTVGVASLSIPEASTFRFNYNEEALPSDGKVLCTNVTIDRAVEECDALFDNAFSGTCVLHVKPFPNDFDVDSFCFGVITGPSGSSKSIALREHFGLPTTVEWDGTQSIVSHFGSKSTGHQLLKLVELDESLFQSSYDTLSKGQKHLADIARMLQGHRCYVDEFTSHLDRALACRVAGNISSFLKARNPNTSGFVFVTCHVDILDHIQPDWIFETVPPQLAIAPRLRSNSLDELQLELEMCEPWYWQFFRDHHYKTKNLSSKARTFLLRNKPTGELVGFMAAIAQIGRKNCWRAHRTVVLPTWQGLGIGSRMSDAVAEVHRQLGCDFLAQTVHPRFGSYRDRSPLWKATEWNHSTNHYKIESWKQRRQNLKLKLRVPKFIYSHEYIGPRNQDEEYQFGETRVKFV